MRGLVAWFGTALLMIGTWEAFMWLMRQPCDICRWWR